MGERECVDFGIWRRRRWTIGGFTDNLEFPMDHSCVGRNLTVSCIPITEKSPTIVRTQVNHSCGSRNLTFHMRQRRVESAAGGINPLNVFAVATNRTATPSIRTAIPSTRNRRPTQRNRRPMRRNAVNSEVSHQNFTVICRPNWRKFARRVVFYDKFFIFAVVMVKL